MIAQWHRRLAAIRDAGRWRQTKVLTPTGPTTARLDGRDVLVACSNDYLGLAWAHRDLGAGGGSGSSRLISGSRPIHETLERALGDAFGGQAVLFPSGWHANLSVLGAVLEEGDRVASDALNHASLIDGLRLARAKKTIVPHGDGAAWPADVAAIVTEGLFSMDGDLAPLDALPAGPLRIVDEAHAVGCLGPGGRGVSALLGARADIVIGTFGKALGASGAFAVGPPPFADLVRNVARAYIFTTAPSEGTAAAALAGFQRAGRDDELRARLATVSGALRDGLRGAGWNVLGSAHILSVVLGDDAVPTAAKLLDRGVYAAAIRWPTVPRGSERIRLCASAAMTDADVQQILDAFGAATLDSR